MWAYPRGGVSPGGALSSGQRINVAKSCVVPLGTLPPSPPAEVARAGPLTVVASKKCLGVTFGPATAQFFEPVGREGLRRQWRQPALGRLPQPSAVWDTRLASVEVLFSRLLGLDLSVMGRCSGATGYAVDLVWYHAEFEGISPGHLADLERMLQFTADGQPPRPDGAGSRGSPTVSWQAALQKGAMGYWRHGSIWWLGVPSGPPTP
jgi:hypothetical protein